MFARFALFGLLIGGLVACDQISPEISFDMDAEFSYITVTISEEDADYVFERVMAETPISEPSVELLDDAVVISGVYTDPTLGSVPGSITASIEVVDGEPVVSVTDIDLPNVTITQSALDQLNEEIAAGIRADMAQRDDNSVLTAIEISDDELSFTIQSPR
jgi:hypothetical protein